MLINTRRVGPLQACTPVGGRLFVLHGLTSLSSAVFQTVSDVVLSSVVQSSYYPLLFAICLHDYGLSFRDVPASDQSDVDGNHQGDGDSDSESGVEAAGFETDLGIALRCVRSI